MFQAVGSVRTKVLRQEAGDRAAAQENEEESKEMSKDLKGGRGEKGCMKIWEESSRKRA